MCEVFVVLLFLACVGWVGINYVWWVRGRSFVGSPGLVVFDFVMLGSLVIGWCILWEVYVVGVEFSGSAGGDIRVEQTYETDGVSPDFPITILDEGVY